MFSIEPISNLHKRRGQATLSLAILVGSAAVLIGLTVAFLALSFLNTAAAFQAGNQALTAAASGVDDALLKIVRFKALNNLAGYTITVGGASVIITIANTVTTDGKVVITSTAKVSRAERSVQAVASVDSLTSKVTLVSFREIVVTLPAPPPPLQ